MPRFHRSISLVFVALCAALFTPSGLWAEPLRFDVVFNSITELENQLQHADFEPGQGRSVHGHVAVPATVHADMPAVVISHGSGGLHASVKNLVQGRRSSLVEAWTEYLVTHGYVVFIVDSYTTRGYFRKRDIIPCHTPDGTVLHPGPCEYDGAQPDPADSLDERHYRVGNEPAVSHLCGGLDCISNTLQRAYDVNHAADLLVSEGFTALLRQSSGHPQASIDAQRRMLFGHSAGGSTTMAAMFRGHADGQHLAPLILDLLPDYPQPRFASAVAFYPGCFLWGAFRDGASQSLYYPYAPLLVLHANADPLYRNPVSQPGHCEWRVNSARPLMAAELPDGHFEMVVYHARGKLDADDEREGIRHGFDRAFPGQLSPDPQWLIPEGMARIHADALLLHSFDIAAARRAGPLSASRLRREALIYQAHHAPALPPTLVRPLTHLGSVDRDNVDLLLPELIHNPYRYDVPSNPDASGVTEPADFAIAYAMENLPEGLWFDTSSHRIHGAVAGSGTFSFQVRAENALGRYRQQFFVRGDGSLGLGHGYRLDTANGVMAEQGTLTLALDLYQLDAPGNLGLAFHAPDMPGLKLDPEHRLVVDPLLLGPLPAVIPMQLRLGDALVDESLLVELLPAADDGSHPAGYRARFVSHFQDMQALAPMPAQPHDANSPLFGAGFPYQPEVGNLRDCAEVPSDEGLFCTGFE